MECCQNDLLSIIKNEILQVSLHDLIFIPIYIVVQFRSFCATSVYTFTAPDRAGSKGQNTRTPGSKTYTPDELGAMAQRYYDRKTNYYPPEVEVIANRNNTYTIHLYEIMNNRDGTYHTATSAWYTVDASGVGTDDIHGDAVNLAE